MVKKLLELYMETPDRERMIQIGIASQRLESE